MQIRSEAKCLLAFIPHPPMWIETKHIILKPFISRHLMDGHIKYIPRNMHTVFALLCFVVVIHWLIFPYPSGLLHWYCGNLTIAPVPAKQPWWIWINTSCELIMNDCITTTKQSTTKPCAYFLGYTVHGLTRPCLLWCHVLSCVQAPPAVCAITAILFATKQIEWCQQEQ